MSKNIQPLQTLKLKKLLKATTAIYTAAELCDAQGIFPTIYHRLFCQPLEESKGDIIFPFHRKVCVQGVGLGFERWPSDPEIFLQYTKHTIN